MATWTGSLSNPTGYTTYPKTVTASSGSSAIVQPIVNTATTTAETGYGKSYTKTANGEVDDQLLQDYAAKYGTEARDAVLGYFNDKDTYLSNNGMAGLENYMKNWYESQQPAETTPTQAATTSTSDTTTASTSAVQGANTTNSQSDNSQADALSNNVNEGENKAKQTMTVQSGSDMGGVNYTNADSDSNSTTSTTSSDSVMPGESATPTNQKYNSWIQNASTFGTSDENEKMPLTLTKTVYWESRRKK